MARSILAAVAGFVVWSILWLAGGLIIRTATPGSFRPDMGTDNTLVLLVILALSIGCSLAAGWVTAAVAPATAMASATGLAIVNLLVGIAVQTSSWALLPVWYHLAFLALLVPGILIGASLRAGRGPTPATA